MNQPLSTPGRSGLPPGRPVYVRRYLAKSRKRLGGLRCLRCGLGFAGRDAYDRHIVKYSEGDWCHLPEEVGLLPGFGGWHRLPESALYLDPAISAQGGVPAFIPSRSGALNRQPASEGLEATL